MALPFALANLESAMLEACAREEQWPAQIGAGIYAGVDYAIAHPEVADALASQVLPGAATEHRYEAIIARLTGFLREKAPQQSRLPGITDEALVAGMVALVGDHLRLGRLDRVAELRAELVLLTLLPYLGFEEARRWANQIDRLNPPA